MKTKTFELEVFSSYLVVKEQRGEKTKLIAHLPLNNTNVMKGCPLLPMYETLAKRRALTVYETEFSCVDKKGFVTGFIQADKFLSVNEAILFAEYVKENKERESLLHILYKEWSNKNIPLYFHAEIDEKTENVKTFINEDENITWIGVYEF